jgi:type III pantothenate kinase
MLTIDCGNTRLKWGRFDGDRLAESGSMPLIELGMMSRRLPVPLPQRVVVSNVAGERAAVEMRAALEGQGRLVRWVRAQPEQCGVRNGYTDPAQLGSDRWAALIGARHLHDGACLVVMAGTATTVDVLDADGRFQGGLILPGFALMRQSLTQSTAQLKDEVGIYAEFPRNTADAIASGCLAAQLGAVERMFRPMSGQPDSLCILSGGGAQPLYERLDGPKRHEPHLVLHGLHCIGQME